MNHHDDFGIILIFLVFGYLLYQSSKWFRLNEEDYKKTYRKSVLFFNKILPEEDFIKFKKRDKFRFFLVLIIFVLFIWIFLIKNI